MENIRDRHFRSLSPRQKMPDQKQPIFDPAPTGNFYEDSCVLSRKQAKKASDIRPPVGATNMIPTTQAS